MIFKRKMLTTLFTIMTLTLGVNILTAAAQTNGKMQRASRQGNERREGPERHPMIRRAIIALKGAQDELEDASRDFCGNREAAADGVKTALNQLQMALTSDRAAAGGGMEFRQEAIFQNASYIKKQPRHGRERHPKIRQAIAALERAKFDLQHAQRDFSGHREEAVDAVTTAVMQLRGAINCDKK